MSRIPSGILATYKYDPALEDPHTGETVIILSRQHIRMEQPMYKIRTDSGVEKDVPAAWLVPYEGMQIHWYEDFYQIPSFTGNYADLGIGRYMANRLISRGTESILTDQEDVMTAARLKEGYRLFLHFYTGEIVEIKYGIKMPNGEDLIDPKPFTYDFPAMIKNGDFGQLSS